MELKSLAATATRGWKLDESHIYLVIVVEEEEAWITKKQQLLSVWRSHGCCLGSLKKGTRFETDFADLVANNKHHSDSITY